MKDFKDEFEFNREYNQWVNFPFVISNRDFHKIDWLIFNDYFEKVLRRQDKIQNESIDAIIEYAKDIKFFTKDELNDLKLGIFDIEIQISKSRIVGLIVSYGVEEDENSKIPWKDVYGIWKVYYEGERIVNTLRE